MALHTAGVTAIIPPSSMPFAPYGPGPPPASIMNAMNDPGTLPDFGRRESAATLKQPRPQISPSLSLKRRCIMSREPSLCPSKKTFPFGECCCPLPTYCGWFSLLHACSRFAEQSVINDVAESDAFFCARLSLDLIEIVLQHRIRHSAVLAHGLQHDFVDIVGGVIIKPEISLDKANDP